ncbi:histidine kinase [Paenibacillus sp. WQ 127069]|uniref:Histidine kinase n=1 Tax=Paenibacillus baimaensis TaxID=2982185 RepID=A0ABT2U8N7_9BACL|nr:histidine kinase [Paenibacillus sp. WQ 127069]MCU6790993.1 histidine kinase [Paenibacillus sp. WQ 127069]
MEANKNNFKESTRRLFLLYTFMPIIVLFILFLIFTLINNKIILANETMEANETINQSMSKIYNQYYKEINRMAALPLVIDYAVTRANSQDVYEQFYEFNNHQKVKSVFHIIDVKGIFVASSAPSNGLIEDMVFKDIVPRIPPIATATLTETNHIAYSHDRFTLYTFGKAILHNNTVVGYLVYQLYEEDVQKLIFVQNNEISVITDQHNTIIATTNNIAKGLMNKFNPIYDAQGYIQLNNGRYYVSQSNIPTAQMKVYTLNSLRIEKYAYISLTVFIIVTSILLWVMVHFLSQKMSSRNTASIDKLLYAVNKLQEGHLDAYVEIKTGDEFETLANQFNIMLNRLNELLHKNEELSNLRRLIEVKQLQSQFHPHFIFNVLEILRYAIVVDSQQAQEIVMILSRLLRYSISNDGQTVLMKGDLNHVIDYLKLQQIRFKDRLTYTIDVSTEGQNALVPKLLLQAIIENSIKYGYQHQEALFISIRGYVVGQDLVLEVVDNGDGMDDRRLAEIRDILSSPDNQSKHIGLNNLHRRLVLLYGEQYGIQLQSSPDSGTSVTILIPYEKGDEGV